MKKSLIFLAAALLLVGGVNAQGLTPRQQEGPFYPLVKLADRDNDLTVVSGSSEHATGDVVLLSGHVLASDGRPIVGAIVEIWQTDDSGAYLHPNDPATVDRDMNFQFYGESVTDEGGGYAFRTILPGQYEPRPRHIHFKVKFGGAELITSQLYFEGHEGAMASREPAALTVQLSRIDDALAPVAYAGSKDIILSLGR